MKQYMVIFVNLSPSSSHLYPLQVKNCDSNSRLVVGEDVNGKFRPKGLIPSKIEEIELLNYIILNMNTAAGK